MKLYDKIDELLEQQCYVVDILPVTVPANSDGKYFEIEEFYQLNHIQKLFEKFADIILKCNCYFDFSVNWGNNEDWVINPSPKILYDRIIACAKEKTYLNIIIEKENAMIDCDRLLLSDLIDYVVVECYNLNNKSEFERMCGF